LFAFIIAALAYLAHQFVDLTLERDYLNTKLENVVKFNELRQYKETVAMAPEEARRILEILDRAIVMSETDEGEIGLVGVPEPPTPESSEIEAETTEVAEATDAALTENGSAPPEEEAVATDQNGQVAETESESLQAAWAVWHERSGNVTNPVDLDIEDFAVSGKGTVTFLLLQNGDPGLRVKGRTLVVLAISDPTGKISLVSAPPTDLNNPEQAWELGSKYNIVSSKLVRVQATIPNGSKILNAEVASWDEETKALVFRKKMKIEDN
jgi:hypothetical protein